MAALRGMGRILASRPCSIWRGNPCPWGALHGRRGWRRLWNAVMRALPRGCAAGYGVCCALGYGRSIAVVLAWMLRYGGDTDLEMAAAKLRRICPQMVLPQATRVQILRLAEQRPCPDSNTEKKDTVTSQRI